MFRSFVQTGSFVGSPWAFLCWHSHTYLCSVCLWLGFIFTNLLCCLAKYTWYLRAVLNLLIEISIWVSIPCKPKKEEIGCLKVALEVKACQRALESVTWLHRIRSRSFTDEGGKTCPFTKYMDNYHQNCLTACELVPSSMALGNPAFDLCHYSSSVFYRFF